MPTSHFDFRIRDDGMPPAFKKEVLNEVPNPRPSGSLGVLETPPESEDAFVAFLAGQQIAPYGPSSSIVAETDSDVVFDKTYPVVAALVKEAAQLRSRSGEEAIVFQKVLEPTVGIFYVAVRINDSDTFVYLILHDPNTPAAAFRALAYWASATDSQGSEVMKKVLCVEYLDDTSFQTKLKQVIGGTVGIKLNVSRIEVLELPPDQDPWTER